jgi:hypothetical protein
MGRVRETIAGVAGGSKSISTFGDFGALQHRRDLPTSFFPLVENAQVVELVDTHV